jgi:sn-glycerol 3-phosphate transport system ATP-binding protein
MGRAIVREPAVFLFDEPLSNLDAKLRVQMRLEIRELQAKLGITALYVTHDQVEAMTMADRMIVMNGGIAEQIGTPLDVYERPQTLFAAQFIGSPSMNILDADASAGRVSVPGGTFVISAPDGPVKLGLRPEHVIPDDSGPLALSVHLAEPLGANTLLHGKLEGTNIAFTASLAGVHSSGKRGQVLRLNADPASLHLFDALGQRIG